MYILLEIALKTLFWLTHCFQNWEQSILHFWKLFLLVKLEDSSFNLIYNLPENSFSTVPGIFFNLPCFSGIFLRTCWLWSLSVWSYPALFCMIFGSLEPVLNTLLIDILCWIFGAVFDFLEVKNLLWLCIFLLNFEPKLFAFYLSVLSSFWFVWKLVICTLYLPGYSGKLVWNLCEKGALVTFTISYSASSTLFVFVWISLLLLQDLAGL